MRWSTLLLVFSAFSGNTKALEMIDRENSQTENDLTGRREGSFVRSKGRNKRLPL